MRRSPAVAGQFYPGDPVILKQMLDEFCQDDAPGAAVTGVMVPHAGYVYSGAIAGRVYGRVTMPDRVILLGPNHHGLGHPAAVYATGCWSTPLGDIAIDEKLARELLEATPLLQADTLAHQMEHSLEVQVPFIQYRNPEASLVPICLGHLRLQDLLDLGTAIASVVRQSKEPTLLIASTDMTHFESADSAARKDRLALDRVAALDAEGLYEIVSEQRISMCGFMPTVVLLKAAEALGVGQSEIVIYGNSGDVTHDYSDVVAYAGAVVGPG